MYLSLYLCWLGHIFSLFWAISKCICHCFCLCHKRQGCLCVFQNQKWLSEWQNEVLICPQTVSGHLKNYLLNGKVPCIHVDEVTHMMPIIWCKKRAWRKMAGVGGCKGERLTLDPPCLLLQPSTLQQHGNGDDDDDAVHICMTPRLLNNLTKNLNLNFMNNGFPLLWRS